MPQYLEPGARVSERWSPGRCVTVELREPPAITEDPMTEDRMALVELLQKSGDGDFLRAVAEAVLQILMEADVEGLIGAGRHERTGDRLNYRNGYRDRSLDVLAQLGDLAFRDAGQAHCLHELVDATGRRAADPGLLDHHDQRFLGGLARLQERREVRALPRLGNAQAQRPEPRIEAAIAVAVAVIEPVAGAFVPAGADQAFDVRFHQDLQHRFRHGSQEIAIAALLQQLDKRHSVFGHRVLGDCWWFSQLHRNAPSR